MRAAVPRRPRTAHGPLTRAACTGPARGRASPAHAATQRGAGVRTHVTLRVAWPMRRRVPVAGLGAWRGGLFASLGTVSRLPRPRGAASRSSAQLIFFLRRTPPQGRGPTKLIVRARRSHWGGVLFEIWKLLTAGSPCRRVEANNRKIAGGNYSVPHPFRTRSIALVDPRAEKFPSW